MRRVIHFERGSKRRICRRLRRLIPYEWTDVVVGMFSVYIDIVGGRIRTKRTWVVQFKYGYTAYNLDLGEHCPVHRLEPIVEAWGDIGCEAAITIAGLFIAQKLSERSFASQILTVQCVDPVLEARRLAREDVFQREQAARVKKAADVHIAVEARVQANRHALLTGQPYQLNEQAVFARNALRGCASRAST